MIYASVFEISGLFGKTDSLCQALSDSERARAEGYKSGIDRDRHVCALALLSMLLSVKKGEKTAENPQGGGTNTSSAVLEGEQDGSSLRVENPQGGGTNAHLTLDGDEKNGKTQACECAG